MVEHIKYQDMQLFVERRRAAELAQEFGTPLYVTSESQIRDNYNRLQRAFAAVHDNVTLLFANKANNNVAVRHILTEEGAGGDCFGFGELTFALRCGVPASKLALNGANKQDPELVLAIEAGVTINADSPEELDRVITLAEAAGSQAKLNLRLLPFSFADISTLSAELAEIARDTSHDKWGMRRDDLHTAVRKALGSKHVHLRGLHMHVSRINPTATPFGLAAVLLAKCVEELCSEFGWTPELLDVGGGYAHARDPEGRGPVDDRFVSSPEDYAQAIVGTLKTEFARRGVELPSLWLEPGRYLVSNATILVTEIGFIRKATETSAAWIHVDASTNHCLRSSLENYHYQITPVDRRVGGQTMRANVTGPTCTMDLLARDRELPLVAPRDLLAIWDVGGYAEVMATNFNLISRPPTVLVRGDAADLIRRQETLADAMRSQILPRRLGNRAMPSFD